MPVQNDKRFCEECNKSVPADEVLFDKDGEAITHIGCGMIAGSAETGGEKAAPQKDAWRWLENYWGTQIRETEPQVIPIHVLVDYLETYHRHRMANFRRSSQNQTVSGGVEGAHEGTTADKSAASPELLPTQLPKE